MSYSRRFWRSLMAVATLCACSASVAQADIVLLVNFTNGNPAVVSATGADYLAQDSAIAVGDAVTALSDATPNGNIVSGTNITAEVGGIDRIFDQPTNEWGGVAILDSYIAVRNAPVNLTVGSLEEIEAGSTFRFVVYGVGDNTIQDGLIDYTYNGVTSAAVATESAQGGVGANGDESVVFDIVKVAGVDTISFSNDGPDQWQGINGFSLTGTSVSAVPEPSSAVLLAGLAGIGFIRRRRS